MNNNTLTNLLNNIVTNIGNKVDKSLNETSIYFNNININSNLIITGSSIFNNTISVNSSLNVSGYSLFNSSINVSGYALLNQTSINSSLNVSGYSLLNQTSINSSLKVSGYSFLNQTSINSSLNISGYTLLNQTSINSSINVSGYSFLNNIINTGSETISGLLTANGGIVTPIITLNGTSLSSTLGNCQFNTNLNNINNTINTPNPFLSSFTPTDTPNWRLYAGSVVSNAQKITNSWGIIEHNAQKLTLTTGGTNTYDGYIAGIAVTSGQQYIIKVWVLLGTATNFNIVVCKVDAWNNEQISNFNSVGGQSFSSINGLNTSTYTQISYSFIGPTNNVINIHIGNTGTYQSGITAQTAGTVYTYGWQICNENQTTNILGNLSVDTSISTPAITLNGTSLATTLGLLAPKANPTFTGTVNGITATMVGLGNVNNTADSDKVFTESQVTNLVSDLALKAPIASPTFTGTVKATNINVISNDNAHSNILVSNNMYFYNNDQLFNRTFVHYYYLNMSGNTENVPGISGQLAYASDGGGQSQWTVPLSFTAEPGKFVLQFYIRYTAPNSAFKLWIVDGYYQFNTVLSTYTLATVYFNNPNTTNGFIIQIDYYGNNGLSGNQFKILPFYIYGWKIMTYENYVNSSSTNFITIGNNASNTNIRNNLALSGITTAYNNLNINNGATNNFTADINGNITTVGNLTMNGGNITTIGNLTMNGGNINVISYDKAHSNILVSNNMYFYNNDQLFNRTFVHYYYLNMSGNTENVPGISGQLAYASDGGGQSQWTVPLSFTAEPGKFVLQFYIRYTAPNSAFKLWIVDGYYQFNTVLSTYTLATVYFNNPNTTNEFFILIDYYGNLPFYIYGWKIMTYENYVNSSSTNFITIGNNASNTNIRNNLALSGITTAYNNLNINNGATNNFTADINGNITTVGNLTMNGGNSQFQINGGYTYTGNYRFFVRDYSNGIIGFYKSTANVGSITTNGSSTSYNTTSDYRLKTNIMLMTNAINRMKQLNVYRFNFISNLDQNVDGFIAHEVAEVIPEAVYGEKDQVDAEGNPVYQGLDQSKLVPLLWGALQESIINIENQKIQICNLQSTNDTQTNQILNLQSTIETQTIQYNQLLDRIIKLESKL